MPRKKILPLCVCTDPNCKIPYGYCHCGCGQKTNVPRVACSRLGHLAGQPIRFVLGHHHTQPRPPIRCGVLDGSPVAYIPLTKGKWAIIDRWNLGKVPGVWFFQQGYAAQMRNGSTFRMHNAIRPSPVGLETDHIHSNGLDNRESELRCVTHRDNTHNQSMRSSNTSGYKGVTWHRVHQKWAVSIGSNRDREFIGLFAEEDILAAAHAYDAAAVRHYGICAKLNFPKTADRI